jgi:hypothetical protein
MGRTAVVKHWLQMRSLKGKVLEASWLGRSIGLATLLLRFFSYSFGQLRESRE